MKTHKCLDCSAQVALNRKRCGPCSAAKRDSIDRGKKARVRKVQKTLKLSQPTS